MEWDGTRRRVWHCADVECARVLFNRVPRTAPHKFGADASTLRTTDTATDIAASVACFSVSRSRKATTLASRLTAVNHNKHLTLTIRELIRQCDQRRPTPASLGRHCLGDSVRGSTRLREHAGVIYGIYMHYECQVVLSSKIIAITIWHQLLIVWLPPQLPQQPWSLRPIYVVVNQSINQLINQSINQSINKSINQYSFNKSCQTQLKTLTMYTV